AHADALADQKIDGIRDAAVKPVLDRRDAAVSFAAQERAPDRRNGAARHQLAFWIRPQRRDLAVRPGWPEIRDAQLRAHQNVRAGGGAMRATRSDSSLSCIVTATTSSPPRIIVSPVGTLGRPSISMISVIIDWYGSRISLIG